MSEIQKLIETTAKLRSPEGCPWDREQTHQSLKKYCHFSEAMKIQ